MLISFGLTTPQLKSQPFYEEGLGRSGEARFDILASEDEGDLYWITICSDILPYTNECPNIFIPTIDSTAYRIDEKRIRFLLPSGVILTASLNIKNEIFGPGIKSGFVNKNAVVLLMNDDERLSYINGRLAQWTIRSRDFFIYRESKKIRMVDSGGSEVLSINIINELSRTIYLKSKKVDLELSYFINGGQTVIVPRKLSSTNMNLNFEWKTISDDVASFQVLGTRNGTQINAVRQWSRKTGRAVKINEKQVKTLVDGYAPVISVSDEWGTRFYGIDEKTFQLYTTVGTETYRATIFPSGPFAGQIRYLEQYNGKKWETFFRKNWR